MKTERRHKSSMWIVVMVALAIAAVIPLIPLIHGFLATIH
jgi:hypothetical protein